MIRLMIILQILTDNVLCHLYLIHDKFVGSLTRCCADRISLASCILMLFECHQFHCPCLLSKSCQKVTDMTSTPRFQQVHLVQHWGSLLFSSLQLQMLNAGLSLIYFGRTLFRQMKSLSCHDPRHSGKSHSK